MLELHNTLSDRLEPFTPLENGRVLMYHCGPTVKEPINLSKFRSYLLADVLRRKMEADGNAVVQVMNITDVGHLNEFEEDIIELAAARTGLYAWELVEKEVKLFHEDRKALNVLDAHHYPHAREHITDMIEMIEALEKKGCTYQAGGNLYFDIEKASRLGMLSHRTPEQLTAALAESRTPPHPEKKNALDIDLWRTDIEHQRHWPSPWGRGFPGWHVECVAMGRKYLGESFDIHTGAHDNVFPHHECEIAQGESLSDKPLANYWLHSGEVKIDGQPMSLKNRNMVTVHELLEAGFRGAVIRVALLSVHYSEPLEFSEERADDAREKVNSVLGFHEYLVDEAGDGTEDPAAVESWITEADEAFNSAIDANLDYPAGLKVVTDLTERLEPEDIQNPGNALAALRRWDAVLGILG